MSAPVDLTAVKAMLLGACRSSIHQWAGRCSNYSGDDDETVVLADVPITPDRERLGIAPGMFEFSGPGSQGGSWVILDADKLAATVAEWFADHYEQSMGDKMLTMIRKGQEEAGTVSTLTAFPNPPWANAGTAT